MKVSNLITAVLVSILLSLIGACTSEDIDMAPTLLMDAKYLQNTKSKINQHDSQLKPAFDQLLADAEIALQEGPFTVTDKTVLPPSGNKHDYASYSRYWWPDTNKVDGLPYLRKDGETNPASQSLEASDRQRIGALGLNCETLGLAYYLTGDQRYAEKVAELLRVWFLDSLTCMNPNLNHAQCRPGHNQGSKTGVLDGRLMVRALEGGQLIANSSALSYQEYAEIKSWSKQYFKWLTTNELALQEAASNNNHGSYYDLQALYFALYSGHRDRAKQIAEQIYESRVLAQIKPDGTMPKELARTRPLFYSIYNLGALSLVAHLAKEVDVDIWQGGRSDSRLRAAIDFVAPYADPNKQWPQPTLGDADRTELYSILQMAQEAFPDGNYLQAAENLPSSKRQVLRSNLVPQQMQ